MNPLALLIGLSTLLPTPQDGADLDSCRIHGRLVDGKGDPVAEAELSLRVLSGRAPADWIPPAPTRSDDKGRFELDLTPPPEVSLVLDLTHPDFGRVGWEWKALEPGGELDLGETLLEPPAVLEGTITDIDGNRMIAGWSVRAMHGTGLPDAHRALQESVAVVDPTTGRFRIDDLPPGVLWLRADGPAPASINDLRWVTKGGELNEIALQFPDQDPARMITLRPFATPYRIFGPAPGSVHLIAADGTRSALEGIRYLDLFKASNLDPGLYTLEITDPRFEPWRLEGVRTGETVHAQLVGNAAIQLLVYAPDDPRPLEAYGLRLDYPLSKSSPHNFTLVKDGASAPAEGRFEKLMPGFCTLEVRVADHPPHQVPLGELMPGQTRVLVVTVGGACALEGRVLNADGSAAAKVRVQVAPDDPAEDEEQRAKGALDPGSRSGSGPERETTTDREGRFRFDELACERYTVHALSGNYARAWTPVDLGGARGGDECLLQLPPLGSIQLSVELPDGLDPEHVRAGVRGVDGQLFAYEGTRQAVPLDADARCVLEGVPAGEVSLGLWFDSPPTFFSSSQLLRFQPIELAAGERLRHTLRSLTGLTSRVEVEVRVGGRSGSIVEFQLVPPSGMEPLKGMSLGGRKSFARVPAGSYELRVLSPLGGWTWSRPDPLPVGAAALVETSLDVPIVERALLARGPDGSVLANADLTWWCAGLEAGHARMPTDSDGLLLLGLPAGHYSIARNLPAAPAIAFEWSASDEPLEVVIPDVR